MPGQREARERRLLDRLDLAPQARDGRAPDAPQHLDVAPFAARPARPQRAADERALALERNELALGDRRLEAVALGQEARRKRPAPACEARHQRPQRVRHGLEEGGGHAAGRHRAERVAVAAGVLGGDQALLAADPQAQSAAIGQERLRGIRGVTRQPRAELGVGEVADPAQQVVQGVGAAAALAAELLLHLLDGVGVQ